MIFFSVLLLLTVPLYFGAVLTTATLTSGDGEAGLSRSFAYILTAALWTALAAIMATVFSQTGISTASAAAALVLVPASGVAAIAAIAAHTPSREGSSRRLIVGWTAPLLIIGFASWTYFPALHGAAPEWMVGGFAWSALLVLSISPWWTPRTHSTAMAAAELSQAGANSDALDPLAAARQNRRDAFQALGPHVALRKWLPYLNPGNELRDEALAAIRQSPRRQADTEFLLKSGTMSLWHDIAVLDLKLTPTFADLGRKFIQERAHDIRPLHPGEAPNFEYMASRIEPYVGAIKWLVAQHCDCRIEILSLTDAVKLYPESTMRNAFISELVALRPPAVSHTKPPVDSRSGQSLESSH
ncbi:MAG: hypothetical protein ABIV50_10955 [Opitutus sp.]